MLGFSKKKLIDTISNFYSIFKENNENDMSAQFFWAVFYSSRQLSQIGATAQQSSPINLKFTFLPLSKPKWHFFSFAVSGCCCSINKNRPNNQNISEKVKFDKNFNWLGKTLCDINLKINGTIVIPQFSTICGQFWWHTWKIYPWLR